MDVYGLIGNPVGHSLSPPLHEAGYDALGLDARYVTFEPPADEGALAVESAARLGVSGLNVTIPFKEDVFPAVDPDDLAAHIGAVNTIDFSTDPPTGYNTDAAGVVRAFAHHDVALEGNAVVVGAGGAGRAAAFALAAEGMAVDVVNRTVERATALAADVTDAADAVGGTASGTSPPAEAHSLDALPDLLPAADVLVNATSVGMEEDRSPVPRDALHADLSVLDAVYTPVETRLLGDARQAGATTVDGGWMLLFQGVEAFERWTGAEAPVEAMNEALRSRLAAE